MAAPGSPTLAGAPATAPHRPTAAMASIIPLVSWPFAWPFLTVAPRTSTLRARPAPETIPRRRLNHAGNIAATTMKHPFRRRQIIRSPDHCLFEVRPMNIPTLRLLGLSIFSFLFLLTTYTFPQGSLIPPDAPGPTMKTLDQVEGRIMVNATNTPGDASNTFIVWQPGS